MRFKFQPAFFFAGLALFTACSKEDEEPPVEFSAAAPGTMKAKVNGAPVNTLAIATNAQATSVVRMEISGVTGKDEMLSLVFPVIQKTGVYDSVAVGRFVMLPSNHDPGFKVWAAPVARLTITKLDTLGKKISGTFAFSARADSTTPAMGTREITEGTFSDVQITD